MSDFVAFVNGNPGIFVEGYEILTDKQKWVAAQKYISSLLIHLQDCIDFEATVDVLIDAQRSSEMTHMLEHETDECYKNTADTGEPPSHEKSAREKHRDPTNFRYFMKYPRYRLLISMIN